VTGFSQKWIAWIMLCVEIVDYLVIINGDPVGPINPSRGLHQGDPLLPYTFILCLEDLSTLVSRLRENEIFMGPKFAGMHRLFLIFFM